MPTSTWDPNECFIKCIQPFSMQALSPFFIDTDPFFLEVDEIWTLNLNHPFFVVHKQASWAMKIIASEYLLQAQSFQSGGTLDSSSLMTIREKIGLRLKEQVGNLLCDIDLDILTSISGERYEDRDGIGLSLVILPYPLAEDQLRSRGAKLLNSNVWFKLNFENVHALRKQLNLSKNASLAVCCLDETCLRKAARCGDNPGFFAVGLLPSSEASAFPCIYYTGHMEWQLYLPSSGIRNQSCYLQCCQGRLFLPPLDMSSLDRKIVDAVFSPFPVFQKETISRFLEIVRTRTKGGAMIVIADYQSIISELNRLCIKHVRGFYLQEKINLLVEPDYLERFLSVDGAIFVDLDGCCCAYGVLVDGTALIEGDMSRGSRYNNAFNYEAVQCSASDAHLLVFVRSEDGMTNFFPGFDRVLKKQLTTSP